MNRLFYFTHSYPFGLGEAWKTEELMFLSDAFEEIIVVPYCFGGDKKFKGIKKENIVYNDPIITEFSSKKVWKKLLSILFHLRFYVFLGESFKYKVFLNKNRLIYWVTSTYKIIELKRNQRFNQVLKELNRDDYAFFFWGRDTSEYLGGFDIVAKKIIRFHGYDLYAERYKGNYLPYQEKQLKKADLVLCISKHGESYLKYKYSKLSDKVKLNLLGIMNENPENVCFKECHIKTDKLKIFTCSSLIPLKRMTLLMLALMRIRDINIEWTHIGSGPEQDKLMKLSKKLGENVSFQITGWLTRTEIYTLYRNNKPNLFINLSTSEGLAVSLMEACSFGVPIIATNVGGNSELVDESNGMLIDKNITPPELSKLIRQYALEIDENINSFSMHSLNKFKTKLDAKNTKRELIQILNNL